MLSFYLCRPAVTLGNANPTFSQPPPTASALFRPHQQQLRGLTISLRVVPGVRWVLPHVKLGRQRHQLRPQRTPRTTATSGTPQPPAVFFPQRPSDMTVIVSLKSAKWQTKNCFNWCNLPHLSAARLVDFFTEDAAVPVPVDIRHPQVKNSTLLDSGHAASIHNYQPPNVSTVLGE